MNATSPDEYRTPPGRYATPSWVLVLLAIFALNSCGAPAPVPGDVTGSDAAEVSTPDSGSAVALVVNSSTSVMSVVGQAAHAGHSFLVTDIVLANRSVPSPIIASQVAFSLTTSAALVYQPSAFSVQLAHPCPTSTEVAQGGMVSCQLAFELPTSETATTLSYNDQQGHTASAAVPVPMHDTRVATCQQHCVDHVTGPASACYACLSNSCMVERRNVTAVQMIDPDGYNGWTACFVSAGQCSDAARSDNYLGSCTQTETCAPPDVMMVLDALWSCEVAACAAQCP